MDADKLKRFAASGHDKIVDLSFNTGVIRGNAREQREFFDAVYVMLLQLLGAAIKESLEPNDRQDGRAV